MRSHVKLRQYPLRPLLNFKMSFAGKWHRLKQGRRICYYRDYRLTGSTVRTTAITTAPHDKLF